MKKDFLLASYIEELKLLAKKSPRTKEVQELLVQAHKVSTMEGNEDLSLKFLIKYPVQASNERWADISYQSLYIKDDDPEHRIVLQEPPSKEPSVCVMVLKAARLQGESGMVYCGTPSQLEAFKSKLPEYEEISDELGEKEFLLCLAEVAEKEFGLKIIYHQISIEHGGDEDFDMEWSRDDYGKA